MQSNYKWTISDKKATLKHYIFGLPSIEFAASSVGSILWTHQTLNWNNYSTAILQLSLSVLFFIMQDTIHYIYFLIDKSPRMQNIHNLFEHRSMNWFNLLQLWLSWHSDAIIPCTLLDMIFLINHSFNCHNTRMTSPT